jgi:L-ascorbate metabolism protein UlaG (beta-lactamase superfamily)
MNKFLLVAPVALVAVVASPARAATPLAPQVLVVPAQGGPIRITPIFHGSLQIEYRGKVIHVDPFSQGNYKRAKKADVVVITHTHPDHMDEAAIKRVAGSFTHLIGPESVTDALMTPRDDGKPSVLPLKHIGFVPLKNGQSFDFRTSIGGAQRSLFQARAVPMYNLKRERSPGQKFHPKGEYNGYVLTLGGKRIYIAGDTEATPEMKKLKNIDVAFLPMNLPYTMTPQEAAGAARAFKPKMAVPYHYRAPFNKPNQNPQQFERAMRGSGVKVRLFDWYRN